MLKDINTLREYIFNNSYTIDENEKISHADDKIEYKDEINLLSKNRKFMMCAGINHVFSGILRDHNYKAYTYTYGLSDLFTHTVTLIDFNDKYYLHDAYLNRYLEEDLLAEIKKLKNDPEHKTEYKYGIDINKREVTKNLVKKKQTLKPESPLEYFDQVNPEFYDEFPEEKNNEYFVATTNIHDWIKNDIVSGWRVNRLNEYLYINFNSLNLDNLIAIPLYIHGKNGFFEFSNLKSTNLSYDEIAVLRNLKDHN